MSCLASPTQKVTVGSIGKEGLIPPGDGRKGNIFAGGQDKDTSSDGVTRLLPLVRNPSESESSESAASVGTSYTLLSQAEGSNSLPIKALPELVTPSEVGT